MSGSGPMRELNRTRKVEVALQNEYLTRQRVEKMERQLMTVGEVLKSHKLSIYDLQAQAFGRNFWGRMRWLLTGR